MLTMGEVDVDLIYDPNDIGSDCVVRCLLSDGPRGGDLSFDPVIGDRLVLVDDDDELLIGRVTARDGDRIWVQVDLDVEAHLAHER